MSWLGEWMAGRIADDDREPWVKPRLFKFRYDRDLHILAPSDGPLAVMTTMKLILDQRR